MGSHTFYPPHATGFRLTLKKKKRIRENRFHPFVTYVGSGMQHCPLSAFGSVGVG